ncbi:hypothetical protein THAOC_05781, partial [Thalassiosira oceanica]
LQQIFLTDFHGEPSGGWAWCELGKVLQYSRVDLKYEDGDEPDELSIQTKGYEALDVSIITSFRNLRSLVIEQAPLNGMYRQNLFGIKSLLSLDIKHCESLKFDLASLAEGMPNLENLVLESNPRAFGDLSVLACLSGTLRELTLKDCDEITTGDFMFLRTFPNLEVLNLSHCKVIGDVELLAVTDFPNAKQLHMPKVLASFAQSTRILHVLAGLAKRHTSPCITTVQLSEQSSDFYGIAEERGYKIGHVPPFTLEIVKAGPRVGWRWTNTEKYEKHSCDLIWLDPMPLGENDVSEFNEAVRLLEADLEDNLYKGKCAPLSKHAYYDLCREEKEKRRKEGQRRFEALVHCGAVQLPGYADDADDTDDDTDDDAMMIGSDDE